jgi:D-arabinose 5-phosphate isomerase GutQ
MLLAATAATCSLQARYVHSEDLLHGELSALREDGILIAISWSGQSEQIRELIARAPSITVLLTSNRAALLEVAPTYVIEAQPVADNILSGIPAESIMEMLRVGYSLIAGATTHAERRAALLSGHPHGALAKRLAEQSAELIVQSLDSLPAPLRTD